MGYVTVRHNVPNNRKAEWKADFNHKDAVRKDHGVSGSAITEEGDGYIIVTHKISDEAVARAHMNNFQAVERPRMDAVGNLPL